MVSRPIEDEVTDPAPWDRNVHQARETIDVAGNEPGPHFWRFAQVGVMPAAELPG